jgi:hypothetical protein
MLGNHARARDTSKTVFRAGPPPEASGPPKTSAGSDTGRADRMRTADLELPDTRFVVVLLLVIPPTAPDGNLLTPSRPHPDHPLGGCQRGRQSVTPWKRVTRKVNTGTKSAKKSAPKPERGGLLVGGWPEVGAGKPRPRVRAGEGASGRGGPLASDRGIVPARLVALRAPGSYAVSSPRSEPSACLVPSPRILTPTCQ